MLSVTNMTLSKVNYCHADNECHCGHVVFQECDMIKNQLSIAVTLQTSLGKR